jgi:hypothetical protein
MLSRRSGLEEWLDAMSKVKFVEKSEIIDATGAAQVVFAQQCAILAIIS